MRVLAEAFLQEHGHKTLSTGTSEQALALLEGGDRVDLIFTDVALHGDFEAGLALARQAAQRVPGVPVLYTTGQGLTDGMQAMFVEPYGFLAKPYTPEQLIIAVDNLTK